VHSLMSVEELAGRLDDRSLRTIDCRFALANPDQGRVAHAIAHIPGAVYAHLDEDLAGPVNDNTGRHPLPEPAVFAARLGEWGISPDTEVVVYDDEGGAFAARLWWMLQHWIGHTRVRLLDGGLKRWMAGQHPIDNRKIIPVATRYPIHTDDRIWVAADQVAKDLAQGKIMLVDARSEERFCGKQEPIDPVAGHVPGAVNLPFAGNLQATGEFLPTEDLRRRYQPLLDHHAPSDVVHMCGSGVNACINLLAMNIAGFHGSRLYVGSWSDWIRDPRRPIG